MNVGRENPRISDRVNEDEDYILDEGWWSSLLAEEEDFESPLPQSASRSVSKVTSHVNWQVVQGYHDRDEIICLEVQGYNRGGLLVQGENLHGFVPISHLVDVPATIEDDQKENKLKTYLGKTLELKVIECNPAHERVVLSERAAQAGEGCRKKIFSKLVIGEKISGTVTNVTDFGVFVDLGGVEGLIHVSELSWGRVRHPKDILSVGKKIDTIVLDISEENERVALSYKRMFHNPWSDIVDYYAPGDVIPATITSITRYGAFARIQEGIEGLIHISTMNVQNEKPSMKEFVNSGQEVMVKILHIDVKRRRLGLGLTDLE